MCAVGSLGGRKANRPASGKLSAGRAYNAHGAIVSIPYIPLYVTDYEADTSHLTLEEDGAYMRLLRLCWRTPGCSIPDDPEWIKRRLRVDDATYGRSVAPVIEEFFSRAKARLSQSRLQCEWERINGTSQKRREAGKKGGRPSKPLKTAKNSESRAKAGPKQNESIYNQNQNHIDASAGVFEGFWRGYPRKQGTSKANAHKVFERLKPEEQKQAVAALAEFSRSVAQTEERYIPHAATWLNQRRFETLDEQKPTADPALWRLRLERLRDSGFWDAWLGPRPGTLGCDCPDDLQREFGFVPRPARSPP